MDYKVEKLHPEKILRSKNLAFAALNTIIEGFARATATYQERLVDALPSAMDEVSSALIKKFGKEKGRVVAATFCTDIFAIEATMVMKSVIKPLPGVNPKFYVAQKDFLKDFYRVSLKNLRFRDLKDICGYIHLPLPITDNDGTAYKDIYFFLGNNKDFMNTGEYKSFHSLNYEVDMDRTLVVASFSDDGAQRSLSVPCPKDENMSLEVVFKDIADMHTSLSPTAVLSCSKFNTPEDTGFCGMSEKLVSLLVYLGSGQPDIREFRNTVRYGNRNKKRPVAASHPNLSALPIQLVGYNWLKEREVHYSTGEWGVKSHPRWQRCGEGFKDVKLIWVKEHTKKRRKLGSI